MVQEAIPVESSGSVSSCTGGSMCRGMSFNPGNTAGGITAAVDVVVGFCDGEVQLSFADGTFDCLFEGLVPVCLAPGGDGFQDGKESRCACFLPIAVFGDLGWCWELEVSARDAVRFGGPGFGEETGALVVGDSGKVLAVANACETGFVVEDGAVVNAPAWTLSRDSRGWRCHWEGSFCVW